MINRYNTLSFLFFIPGIIVQIVGLIISQNNPSPAPLSIVGTVLLLVGTVMAITGFAYYAKAKGRSPLWGIAGMIGLPGLLVLAILKDKSGDPWNT